MLRFHSLRLTGAVFFMLIAVFSIQSAFSQGYGKKGRAEDKERRVAAEDKEEFESDVVVPGQMGIDQKTVSAFVRNRSHNPQDAVDAGLLWTGLTPVIPSGFTCPGVMDDEFAMDYSGKQGRPFFHGGIDLAAPEETPIIAVAAGQVVAVFEESGNPKGREVVILHAPEITGLDRWVYTQYTHFAKSPVVTVGQMVKQGQLIGINGNSGARRKPGAKNPRRHALHYVAFISDSPVYAINNNFLIPKNGRWVDPLALYRPEREFDSKRLSGLDSKNKQVTVRVSLQDGSVHPSSGPFIWPMVCQKR